MLKLRLSMGGTKKRPVYKIVVADSRFSRDGRFIEKLGFFNPLIPKDKKERVGLEAERIKYWLGQGAQPTTRVARILGENQIMPMPQKGNNPQKAVPKKDRKKKKINRRHQKTGAKHQKLLKKKRKQKLLRKRKRKKLLKKKRKRKLLRKRKNKNVYCKNIYFVSRHVSRPPKRRIISQGHGKEYLEFRKSRY